MRLIPTTSKLKYAGGICRINEPFEARDEDVASLMACGCVLAETECSQESCESAPALAPFAACINNQPETPFNAFECSNNELQGKTKKKPERARKTRKKTKEV